MDEIRAVITGQSRGLGAALATVLLGRGASVLGISRRRNDALGGGAAGRFVQLELDLSDVEAFAEWLRGEQLRTFLEGGSRLLLINNAGTVQPIGPLTTQDPRAIARSVALNVSSPLMLTAAFVTQAPPESEQRILHISSGAARHAYAGWSIYCATKAALDHHARAVELDASPRVRISSIAPGVIDTEMQAELRTTPQTLFPDVPRFLELKRRNQLEDPAEIAERLVDLMLSDEFGDVPVSDLRD